MSITVSNISKNYGAQKALNEVSFEVQSGQITGFLGPNGAGKSTLMKILTTYLLPDNGTALVAGHPVLENPKQVQRTIGYLPEHNPLYLDMYVREYLRFRESIYNPTTSRIDAVIEQTGLSLESHKKIKELSKGYRQRVGLAAALLHDPEVLILDEPTTGLDPNQLMDIRNLITELGKTKTILLSTHIMQEVEAMCDAVVVINKGEIVARKTMKELQQGDKQIIQVEFDYRVEPELLQQIKRVRDVKGSGFHFELHFETHEDMRSSVFDFAHDNGLKILALNKKNQNLESLFREMTS